uniref:Uncharacterized protein n=1 Tax=Anguilla anguilla TaxID=7936 RepID=A0A0E9VK51_ANGAN
MLFLVQIICNCPATLKNSELGELGRLSVWV